MMAAQGWPRRDGAVHHLHYNSAVLSQVYDMSAGFVGGLPIDENSRRQGRLEPTAG